MVYSENFSFASQVFLFLFVHVLKLIFPGILGRIVPAAHSLLLDT